MPDWREWVRHRLPGPSPDADREAEVVEELAGHLEMAYEEAREGGASEEEARRRAERQLGDAGLASRLRRAGRPVGALLDPAARVLRDRGSGAGGLIGLAQDLRHAGRKLVETPAFTLAAVLTLGLGIGAGTAIFSVVNGVLLRPLPYDHAGRLGLVRIDAEGYRDIAAISAPELVDLREQADRFDGFGALWGTTGAITDGDEPEHLGYAWVTADLFPLLGVRPVIGRGFRPEEDDPGAAPAVILGEGLWRRRYGGDPGILGRTIELDDAPRTVVGIAPAGLKLPRGATTVAMEQYDAFIPQTFWTNRDLRWLRVVGRVRAGVPFERASEQLAQLGERLLAQHDEYEGSRFRLHLTPLQDALVGPVRPRVLTLAAAVGFLLLIACANVANLLLVRSRARGTEIAVRTALGAGPFRILRQVLVENLLLALVAGAVGVALALAGVRLLLALRPPDLPRVEEIGVDGTVLLAALAASVLTALLFGLAPLWQALRVEVSDALRQGTRASEPPAGARLRGILVVAEVAISIVLLIGAGLMVRTFVNLQQVDPGFLPQQVLTFRMPISARAHPGADERWGYYRRLQEELRQLPGVDAVGGVSLLPLGGGLRTGPFAHDAATEAAWGERTADYRTILPGYFESIGARLIAGRYMDAADAASRRSVLLVDETLARLAWPGEDAVGKRLKLLANPTGNQEEASWAEVVGIVAHIRSGDLRGSGPPQIYRPFWLDNPILMSMTVRTTSEPVAIVPAVRTVVNRLGGGRPAHGFRVLEGFVDDALSSTRLTLVLMGLFAVMAAILAVVGLYAVLACSVSQRTREFGVRVALGAGRPQIFRLVLGKGMRLTLLGIALGCAGAYLLTGFLERLLFGVDPADPLVFVLLGAMLGLVALAACLPPAHRATRVDAIVALRDG